MPCAKEHACYHCEKALIETKDDHPVVYTQASSSIVAPYIACVNRIENCATLYLYGYCELINVRKHVLQASNSFYYCREYDDAEKADRLMTFLGKVMAYRTSEEGTSNRLKRMVNEGSIAEIEDRVEDKEQLPDLIKDFVSANESIDDKEFSYGMIASRDFFGTG